MNFCMCQNWSTLVFPSKSDHLCEPDEPHYPTHILTVFVHDRLFPLEVFQSHWSRRLRLHGGGSFVVPFLGLFG
jgi:hypothetical protein